MIRWVWGGACQLTFLKSSQVLVMLWFQGPRFEYQDSRPQAGLRIWVMGGFQGNQSLSCSGQTCRVHIAQLQRYHSDRLSQRPETLS